jgi:N-acetyl-gamma-glutamyl-phosphate reductase
MATIKIGIMGGAGYTGGELLRLLVHHPGVEIVFVHSNSQATKKVAAFHAGLTGDTELVFTDRVSLEVDLVFLCVGHGEAKPLLAARTFPPEMKIIDLSQDFRLQETSDAFVYGLPELNRDRIKTAHSIANPGCFATAIQLGVLPLAAAGLLDSDIHVTATTGSTGAGQSPSETAHYSWRDSNLSVYKAFTHQHLGEIAQTIRQLQPGYSHETLFVPQRGAFTRGILAGITLQSATPVRELRERYTAYFADHPFVHLCEQPIDLKQVVNTNKCLLYLEQEKDRLLIVSVIDNLLKGASGQAVQNMNLLFGLEETTGLRLKASAF